MRKFLVILVVMMYVVMALWTLYVWTSSPPPKKVVSCVGYNNKGDIVIWPCKQKLVL